MSFHKKLIGLAVIASLSACSTATMKPINEGVAVVDTQATAALEVQRVAKPLEKAPEARVKRSNTVWFPVTKIESLHTPAVAATLKRQVVVNRRVTNVNEATAYITSLTGIATSVSLSANARNSLAAEMGEDSTAGSQTTTVPAIQTPFGTGTSSASNSLSTIQQISYSGELSGLLDLVSSRYNLNWEWESNGIRFFKTKAKTFRLTALPGDTSLSSRIGTSSSSSTGVQGGGGSSSTGGSTGGGTSQMNAGVEFSGMSVWKGIEDSINTMLSDEGRVTVTPATGTITVEDTPRVLDAVTKFVESQNEALARQVVINVKVLSVDLASSNEYGINWDVVYQNLGRSVGFNLANIVIPDTNATNMTFNILPGSMFEGSSAMISALSKQGKVSQVTSASLVTINNQPAPIQVARQTSYLASSETTLGVAGSGNTVSLQPGVITTGFSMNVLPHILDNNKLMLQYAGDISDLIRITQVDSGGSSIQTPEIDTRNFMQRVILTSGETLVVTGFEQFNLKGNTHGVGSAENLALGGGVKTSNGKSVLVVLIQPVLLGAK